MCYSASSASCRRMHVAKMRVTSASQLSRSRHTTFSFRARFSDLILPSKLMPTTQGRKGHVRRQATARGLRGVHGSRAMLALSSMYIRIFQAVCDCFHAALSHRLVVNLYLSPHKEFRRFKIIHTGANSATL